MKQEKDIREFFETTSGKLLPQDDGFMEKLKAGIEQLPVPAAFEKPSGENTEETIARLSRILKKDERKFTAETVLSVLFSCLILLAGLIIGRFLYLSSQNIYIGYISIALSGLVFLFMLGTFLPIRK